ncbi:hypothetical protein [Psychrobacter sp. Cmf 22.2]|uniref:hypothetical protein n=1 Tax=Psychrobacter sp. Cmf 22.2 TaxID=1926478 RepID=UPI0009471E6C|nr:hypothetical protein [Psychrobacter sp. Cmf 22.2]OLF37525.1 hypothetical protein BTV98_07875 [Psychrobacter sp. Cmf 22.2]
MQNRTLSLIIGTALAMPGIAMAAPMDQGNITPADMRVTPAPNTLQAEIEGPDGELLATQPGEVESDVNVAETNSDEMNDPNMMENPEEMANPVSEQAAPQALNQQHSNNEYQPLIAGEVLNDDPNSANATVTLQEKTKDNRGELLATQPAEVEFSENRRVVPR